MLMPVASVVHLIKMWLKNQNVIIANEVLFEIQVFANSVGASDFLGDIALEVLECIPDKVLLLWLHQ
jgi:hypothetical protein